MYRKLLLATCLLAMPSMADSGVPPTDNPTTQTEEQGSALSQPEGQTTSIAQVRNPAFSSPEDELKQRFIEVDTFLEKLKGYFYVNKYFLCQWAVTSAVVYKIARPFINLTTLDSPGSDSVVFYKATLKEGLEAGRARLWFVLMLRGQGEWWDFLRVVANFALLYTQLAAGLQRPLSTWWAGGAADRAKMERTKRIVLDMFFMVICVAFMKYAALPNDFLKLVIGEGFFWTLLSHALYIKCTAGRQSAYTSDA